MLKEYPLSCVPEILHERTGKAIDSLFEEIDNGLYEGDIVTFHTSKERVHAWIKVLHIFYFENLGAWNDIDISWADSDEPWSDDKSNFIIIEVKTKNKVLIYNVTLFVNTGTIRIQGSQYDLYTTRHHVILKGLLEQVISFNAQTQSAHSQSELLEEHDTEGNHSESESECNTTIHHVLSDDTEAKCVDQPVCNTTFNIGTPVITPGGTNSDTDMHVRTSEMVKSFERLEKGVVSGLHKIHDRCHSDTEKILKAIASCECSIKASTKAQEENQKEKITTMQKQLSDKNREIDCLTDTVSQLKEKLNQKEEEILDVTAKLHEATIKPPGENQKMRSMQNELDDKNEEIDRLTDDVGQLKIKLNRQQDEMFNLKSKMYEAGEKRDNHSKPRVLLVGTSNINGIDEEKLTAAAEVSKEVRYTLKDTLTFIASTNIDPPDILILHSLTNDIRDYRAEACVAMLDDIINKATEKWPNAKCIVSLTTPRSDNMSTFTNGQITNALVKEKFNDKSHITMADHSNMLINGSPNGEFLSQKDNYHLNANGTAMLASNLKRAILQVLKIHQSSRQSRSRSPGGYRGRGGRGRGRYFRGRGRSGDRRGYE